MQYSPIRANGFGNQGAYFAEIPEALAQRIAELADTLLPSILNGNVVLSAADSVEVELPSIAEWEDTEQRQVEQRTEIPETQRRAIVLARRGQGLFKQNVSRFESRCRITHVNNPTHLVASHIKPWRESNNDERLSGGNGFLLTPSIDHLFDRGFITFADDGELVISPIADRSSLQRMGVQTDSPFGVGHFNSDQKYFLDYHRKEIFLQSAS
jgi:predicted restriction endonuclease